MSSGWHIENIEFTAITYMVMDCRIDMGLAIIDSQLPTRTLGVCALRVLAFESADANAVY